ncbi:RnfABCDGE type electron transport complex subunit D [Patescibacteria group bacterium]|nr:RnfABCDGE type electron transport complex subunit D [Patescibacteria group bacterium]
MLSYIDYILDRITMYRVILYYLIGILIVAAVLGSFNLLPYSPLEIAGATAVLVIVSGGANYLFSKVYNAPTNLESAYITALILACILPPVHSVHDLPLLVWAAGLAMASKYILAIRNKHLFNPAAIAVLLTAFWLNLSATWWVGTPAMLPVVLIGGILMIRKLRRYDMVFSFFAAALVTSGVLTILAGNDLFTVLQELILRSPLLFFAFVMLTEPLTSPPTNFKQILFGGLVGILFAPQIHFGSLYFTPEMALVIGNLFSYVISPKVKERLVLAGAANLTPDIVEFSFRPSRPFRFRPGQYMEFTLPHAGIDSRGNRRYFTLASSPTEESLRLGIKFYPNSSSFKRNLIALQPNQWLMAGQLAGDFTLPDNPEEKLVFIAGGIGVTPFRSMLKYLTDTGARRTVTLLYMNKSAEEIAYADIFHEAQAKTGARIVYTLTDTAPPGWSGRIGRIDERMVREEVPDFADRTFYISGPHAMVVGIEQTLRNLGVGANRIKKDFFPGLT